MNKDTVFYNTLLLHPSRSTDPKWFFEAYCTQQYIVLYALCLPTSIKTCDETPSPSLMLVAALLPLYRYNLRNVFCAFLPKYMIHQLMIIYKKVLNCKYAGAHDYTLTAAIWLSSDIGTYFKEVRIKDVCHTRKKRLVYYWFCVGSAK